MERSAINVAAAGARAGLQYHDHRSRSSARRLATYKIEKLLGAGGMGEVYLARDTKLDRMVALKILPLHFVADADRLSRFQREARALSSLNHPNLVTIYEVGEANGLHFIAMELVEGKTLSSLRDKLSLKELLSIVAQVAEALGAAHQSGIIHRDIKPDNVMVRPDGYAKVLDFGLVKLSGSRARRRTQQHIHSSAWRWERWLTCRRSRPRASRWTIAPTSGVWAWCSTSSPPVSKPFTGETRQATINAILSAQPEPATDDRHQPAAGSSIAFSTKHSRRIANCVTRRLLISALTFVVCCVQIDSSPTSIRIDELVAVRSNRLSRPRWFWPVVACVC